MINSGEILLSTAYFPPIDYFGLILNSDKFFIEKHEFYQKQSYRNRCNILSSNGVISLSIPIERKGTHKLPIAEIEIDYTSPWISQHKKTLISAYNSSPFFEYYADDIFAILDTKRSSLFQLNTSLLTLLLELLGIGKSIYFTERFISHSEIISLCHTLDNDANLPPYNDNLHCDFRESLHPKKVSPFIETLKKNPYYQLFDNRDFIPNLSVLDLLFNEGPNSISFLKI